MTTIAQIRKYLNMSNAKVETVSDYFKLVCYRDYQNKMVKCVHLASSSPMNITPTSDSIRHKMSQNVYSVISEFDDVELVELNSKSATIKIAGKKIINFDVKVLPIHTPACRMDSGYTQSVLVIS